MRRRSADARLNLSSNELVHPDVAAILRSVPAALTPDLLYRYPVTAQTVTALAQYFRSYPDQIVVTPGSDSALRLICNYHRNQTNGEGTVLLQNPNYAAWEETARLLRLRLRRINSDSTDGAAQTRRLLRAARSVSKALIAVSVPNGPIGGCLPQVVLDELAEISHERGHLLVIDSCYQAFHGPLTARVARSGGPVVVVQSLSKSHGLAGARVAVMCGEPTLIARLAAGPLEHSVSGPSLLAARVAIDHHSEFQGIWSEISQVRDKTADLLRACGYRPLPSGGNFITVRLGTAAAAAAITARVSAAGYRIRDLSGLPGFSGCVRFTIADTATTGLFVQHLLAGLSAASFCEAS